MIGLIETYLGERVNRGELAQSSAKAIRYTLRHWAHHVAEIDPDEWTEDHVTSWLDAKKGGGRGSLNTRKMRLHRLRPFIHWLNRRGHMTGDPTEDIARVVPPKGNPRDLDRAEINRLLLIVPDERALLIVLLMLHCALRCSDVSRVRIEDIDERRRNLHVRAKGGRGEPTHWVPISDELWSVIDRTIRKLGRRSGPLVVSHWDPNEALQGHSISKLVRTWMAEAGLKAFPWDGRSAHALRHTCAQEMVDGGADLREVQYGLGHATVKSTEIYLRREPPGLRDAMTGRTYLSSGKIRPLRSVA